MGLGRTEAGWERTEDFRWPQALESFLAHVRKQYGSAVDLVILGDFLEMWQPPASVPCAGNRASNDLGCTPQEAEQIATAVVTAHARELQALKDFATHGDNRLYLVPGNHDSALLLANVWTVVAAKFGDGIGRVALMPQGVWKSDDRLVFAEHGHQIGEDANRYKNWPTITAERGASTYVIRPWGERFVQALFNEVEREYPIIDNLSPESAGARYRLADRGLARTAGDLARFLAFNLFETSLRQKAQILGDPCEGQDPAECTASPQPPEWDTAVARGLGSKLFVDALPAGDPFRASILEESNQGKALRDELAALLRAREASGELTLGDDAVRQLCDHAAIQGNAVCVRREMGGLIEGLINTKEEVLAKHMVKLGNARVGAAFYVYGHTHQLEEPWELSLGGASRITVANTGAFQRVIGEAGFEKRVRDRNLKPGEALKTLTHDDLPPCYTFVVVTRGEVNSMSTLRWFQPDGAEGKPVAVGAPGCE